MSALIKFSCSKGKIKFRPWLLGVEEYFRYYRNAYVDIDKVTTVGSILDSDDIEPYLKKLGTPSLRVNVSGPVRSNILRNRLSEDLRDRLSTMSRTDEDIEF
jgi:hypothetical protein